MARVQLKAHWHFIVDAEETRLILKALGGRLITEEEKVAARKLGDYLTIERAQEADNLAANLEKHAEAVESPRKPDTSSVRFAK